MGSRGAPIDDAILLAVATLVDDKRSGTGSRLPSHDDLRRAIGRAGLSHLDAGAPPAPPIGKFKRVHTTLISGWTEDADATERLVDILLGVVRGHGGFRAESANYCGDEAIANVAAAYAAHGWTLTVDGQVLPRVLDSLKGRQASEALAQYAERARRGALDSPLLAGVAKDLLEATAIHVVIEKFGGPPVSHSFPVILGQAFYGLGMATDETPKEPSEHPRKRVERAAFGLACALNALRNKEGTGHGRPWPGDLKPAEARFAVESMGNIASLMLDALAQG